MSNTIYEDKMYNEPVKNEFLDDLKEGTKKIFSRLFKVSQILETELGRDLFSFNIDQLRRLFFMYMPKTESSSNSNVTYVSNYISWAIEEGYHKGLNPLDMVDSAWKKQFANNMVKRFWTDKELDKIIESRENAQDAVIIELLRSGIRGSGNSEILNLSKKSVDALNNKLHLEDDNGTRRTITVSDKCIKLCQQAHLETEYSKMNGNASPDIKAPMANLTESDFIVRNALTRTVHLNEADKSVVHRRLGKIADEIQQPNFTPLNISRSGMLQMAKDRILDHGQLTSDDYIEIAIQFGENSDSAIYRLKNDFLTDGTVKELYGLS